MDDHGGTEREKESVDLWADRQVSRRQFLGLVGLAGATVAVGGSLGALVSACGGESTTSTTSAGATGGGSTTPKLGGTLKIIGGLAAGTAGGWPSEFSSLSDDAKPALETLIRIDKDGNIIPWLAESHTLADDSMSITFKLQQGVTFHDGSAFNAEVVKWNLDNVIAAKNSQYFKSVDVLDNYTIRINLIKWSNLVWSDLYESGYTLMVSKAAFEKNGKDWMINHPVGTGPFVFKSFQQEVSLKLARNPSYWKKDAQGRQLPYLDGIDLVYMADSLTQKTAMQAGEGDMTDVSIVIGKAASEFKKMGLTVNPIIGASLCLIPDTGNADSPYAKQEVREALEYAIDRESIAKNFAYGMWTAQYQIPGPASNAYRPDFANAKKFDTAKAKQLLTQAGYPNGFSTTIVVMPIASTGKDIFMALQSYLEAVGIKAELKFTDTFPAYMDAVNGKHSMLNAMQLTDNNANFIGPLSFVLGETAMFNKNWKRTPEFLELFSASVAPKKADTKSIQAVTDYLSEQSALIPMAGSGRAWAQRPYIKNQGAGELSMPAFWKPEQVWLDK